MTLYLKIKIVCVASLLLGLVAPRPCAPQTTGEPSDISRASLTRQIEDYAPFPQPDAGYVSDNVNLLSKKDEEKIERWLWQIESKTKKEIIVVTISSIKDYPGTPNESIEKFATGLFNAYGIGNKQTNDGVLLLVASADRKARIELGANYGRIRDQDAKRIMDQVIIPKFREADYSGGITNGVISIAEEFAQVRIGPNWTLIVLLIAVPVLGILAYSLFKSGKRGWGWVVVGLLVVVILAIIYIFMQARRHMPRTPSGSWAPGGAGGFGGGFSGGGGATGGW